NKHTAPHSGSNLCRQSHGQYTTAAPVLSPTYKQRNEDFRKLFKQLPDTERLIVDYSCALQRDILLQGRLYLSENWICFYSNIFRWETLLTVRLKDICSMTKEKTARLIPNAIQVCTDTEKHFFTSFGARDRTYMMMFRLWQNALLEKPLCPKELWHFVHQCYGNELGLTSDDEDYVPPDDDFNTMGNQLNKLDQISYSIFVSGKKNCSLSLPVCVYMFVCVCVVMFSEVEVQAFHEDLNGRQYINEVYKFSVDKMYSFLFTESQFMSDFMVQRRFSDVVFHPWKKEDAGNQTREIMYTISLSNPLAPKTATVSETQTLYKASQESECYIIDAEVVTHDVPYHDYFYTLNRYTLTRVAKNKCRLKVSTELRYRKQPWGLVKGFIEKNFWSGLEENFRSLGKRHAIISLDKYYRLWMLEHSAQSLMTWQGLRLDKSKLPQTQLEWAQLLESQRRFHEAELQKWREIIKSSVLLLDQMKDSLLSLQRGVTLRDFGSDSDDKSHYH
uniref:GRAM domain containing 1Bb n=1 Tax=Astyanax mexicanus TaxID=7994 RepID=A0A8B9LC77_ASTMX